MSLSSHTSVLCLFISLGCGSTTRDTPPASDEPMNGGPDDGKPSDSGVPLPMPPGGYPPGTPDEHPVIELDLSQCPDEEPKLGEPCPGGPLLCSYGDAAVAGCRNYLQCAEDSPIWETAVTPSTCVKVPADKCPAEVPSGTCPISDMEYWNAPCVYAGGVYCYCEGEGWDCRAAPNAGCPETSPNYGDRCEAQGLTCKYGDPCRGGFVTICRSDFWQPVGVGCPG